MLNVRESTLLEELTLTLLYQTTVSLRSLLGPEKDKEGMSEEVTILNLSLYEATSLDFSYLIMKLLYQAVHI